MQDSDDQCKFKAQHYEFYKVYETSFTLGQQD